MTADTNTNTHVIVGGGLAGAAAATTLREEGFNGGIVLIGAEDDAPYNRPPLSKEYLQGTAARDTIDVHPHQWYVDNHVDLRLGVTVTGIDPAAHEVSSDDGARIRYAKLLLATGSSPRRLPVPGADLDGVEYLRTVGDSDRIKTLLGSAQRVAVIGAGWIGLESATGSPLDMPLVSSVPCTLACGTSTPTCSGWPATLAGTTVCRGAWRGRCTGAWRRTSRTRIYRSGPLSWTWEPARAGYHCSLPRATPTYRSRESIRPGR